MDINLYTPHTKQQEMHRLCSLKHPCKWVVCVAGRQSGKSWAAINQCTFWAFKYPGCVIWYVMPTEDQVLEKYTDMLISLKSIGVIKSSKESNGGIQIVFSNGTVIKYKTAGTKDGLRGSTVDFMVIDECAYIDEKVIFSIMPTMATKGRFGSRKGLLITTPRGPNWVHRWFIKGQDQTQSDIRSLKFTSQDNPETDDSMIRFYKENFPEEYYSQEILANFEDGACIFRNIKEVCIGMKYPGPTPGDNYVFGIDVGMLKDYTVVTIMNSNGTVVDYDRFTRVEFDDMVVRIKDFIRKWKCSSGLIEENNQGLPLFQELKRRGVSGIKGFKTTNQSKEELVNKLISAFSSKEIHCLNDETLRNELQGFIFEMSKTGKIRYFAAPGFHDDMVISLALCWKAHITSSRSSGTYGIMIGGMNTNQQTFFGKDEENTGSEPNTYIMGGSYRIEDYIGKFGGSDRERETE